MIDSAMRNGVVDVSTAKKREAVAIGDVSRATSVQRRDTVEGLGGHSSNRTDNEVVRNAKTIHSRRGQRSRRTLSTIR